MKSAFLIAVAASALFAFPAHAHIGHVGELAGHSHWIGVAAAGAAAVIAIGLTVFGKKDDENKGDDETGDVDAGEAEADAEAKA